MHKLFSLFRITYKNINVYFLDIIGLNLIFVFRIIVIVTLFRVLRETAPDMFVQTSFEAVSWALVFTQIVAVIKSGIANEVSEEIKSGKIVTYLLQPMNYITIKSVEFLARIFSNLAPALIVGIIVGVLFIGVPPLYLVNIFACFILLIGGVFVSFFGYFAIGLLSFYTEDIQPFRWIYSKFDMIFGGNILPVPFLPIFLQTIAFASPFVYGGYTAGLILHDFTIELFLQYLAIQWLWIAILIGICMFIYAHGKQNLVINGG